MYLYVGINVDYQHVVNRYQINLVRTLKTRRNMWYTSVSCFSWVNYKIKLMPTTVCWYSFYPAICDVGENIETCRLKIYCKIQLKKIEIKCNIMSSIIECKDIKLRWHLFLLLPWWCNGLYVHLGCSRSWVQSTVGSSQRLKLVLCASAVGSESE